MVLALQAMRDVSKDPQRVEVIVPAYTCYSVPASVIKAGLKPRLCDVDPDLAEPGSRSATQVRFLARAGNRHSQPLRHSQSSAKHRSDRARARRLDVGRQRSGARRDASKGARSAASAMSVCIASTRARTSPVSKAVRWSQVIPSCPPRWIVDTQTLRARIGDAYRDDDRQTRRVCNVTPPCPVRCRAQVAGPRPGPHGV